MPEMYNPRQKTMPMFWQSEVQRIIKNVLGVEPTRQQVDDLAREFNEHHVQLGH